MLVGLSGYARSGKDTAAAGLTLLGFKRRGFADKLREAALALDPIIDFQETYWDEPCDCHEGYSTTEFVRLSEVVRSLGWEQAKDEYPEVRRTLQRLGTDAGRKVLGQDVWVDAAMADLPTGGVVFTDTRFYNEAQAIRQRGGIVIRVNRPGVGPATDEDGNVHESEIALDQYPFDAVLENVGGIAALHGQIQQAVMRLDKLATV